MSPLDILRFGAADFVGTTRFIDIAVAEIDKFLVRERPGQVLRMSPESTPPLLERVKHFKNQCEDLQMPVSLAAAKRLLDLAPTESARQIRDRLNNLAITFNDELAQHQFLYVPTNRLPWFDMPAVERFGTEVWKQFPSTVFDLEEAVQCFAYERYTACVFHLMRAMEEVVRRWAVSLGINLTRPGATLKDRMWDDLSREIEQKVDALPRSTEFEKDQWNEQRATLVSLSHVRHVWRNATMHPQEKYLDSEAHEVFEASRVLLKKIAGIV